MNVHTVERHRKSLFSDATLGVLGAIGSTGVSGIASIIIARELGVTARGRWAVIASLALIAGTLAASGLPTAAAYASALPQSTGRTRIVQAALAAASALGVLAALGYLSAAAIIRPPAPTVAVIAGLTIPLATVWYAVTHQLTLTAASIGGYALAQFAAALVTLGAIVGLAATTRLTVLMVVLVSAGAQATGAAVSLAALKRYGVLGDHPLVARARTVARVLRPYLSYAAITFATLSLTQIVQRVDVLLVNGFRGPHAAGLYAVAVQATDLMLVVPAALGFVMFRRGARSTPKHFSDAVTVLRWTAFYAVAASVAALALAGWAIPVIFGSAYRGSVVPLRWLLPGTVAFSMQSVLSNYLAGRGRPRIVLVAWLAGAVVGTASDLVVIPAAGIAGAAVVSSVSYILVTGLHVYGLRDARRASAIPA